MPTSKKRKKRATSKSAGAYRTTTAPVVNGVGFHDVDLIHVVAGRPSYPAVVVPGNPASSKFARSTST